MHATVLHGQGTVVLRPPSTEDRSVFLVLWPAWGTAEDKGVIVMRLWRQQWMLLCLLGMLVILLVACRAASASEGDASLGAPSPSPTRTPGMGTPMSCPKGMGPCPPGMMAPGALVQNGQYSD